MTARSRRYVMGDEPIVYWHDVGDEWSDPTFDAACQSMELDESTDKHSLADLELALAVLTDRQRFVVERSWGVNGNKQMSFRELARLIGVHHSTVRDHYSAAMVRLRLDPAKIPSGA